MKTYNFVLLAMALTTVAVYGEPIDLGCNARGPLAALNSSTAFREVIGGANPANFLSSVYDANGQRLTPVSFKTLQCPLFVDSNAEPSVSASKAILRAEAGGRAEMPEAQSTAAVENQPITVISAAGVVAQFPQPEMQQPETPEIPQAVSKAETGRTQNRRAETVAPDLRLADQGLSQGTPKPRQELAAHVLNVPSPKQLVEKREQIPSVAQSQNSPILSFAEATGLIRQPRTWGSGALLEFNPIMALFDFVALFATVLAFCLVIFRPGLRTYSLRVRPGQFRAASNRFDFRAQEGVRSTPRRVPAVSGLGNNDEVSDWSLSGFANSR
jgi:hypothetical protein